MFKTAAICIFLVQAVFGKNLGADKPHIINDCVNPGDNPTILYDQIVSRSGSFLQVQEETRRIPDKGFSPKQISCITVTNLDNDNDAGYPKIKAGGVGNLYVTLHLASQRGKGYEFQITVYYDNSTSTLI